MVKTYISTATCLPGGQPTKKWETWKKTNQQILVFPGNFPEVSLIHGVQGVWSLLVGITTAGTIAQICMIIQYYGSLLVHNFSHLTYLRHFCIKTILWTFLSLYLYLNSLLFYMMLVKGSDIQWNPPDSRSGIGRKHCCCIFFKPQCLPDAVIYMHFQQHWASVQLT